MAQFPDYKKLGLMICPYDETHVIRQEMFSRHLVKCAKNNKTVSRNFTSCEYNHTHKIKRGDGCEHYKQCEDKQWFNWWLERDTMCTKKVIPLSLSMRRSR